MLMSVRFRMKSGHADRTAKCTLLAQSGHALVHCECLLSRGKASIAKCPLMTHLGAVCSRFGNAIVRAGTGKSASSALDV
jgi:hypothetical protein